MKQQTLILGGVLLLLTVCLAFQVPAKFSGKDFAQLAGRLQGDWVMQTSRGKILETWDVPSAVAMRGRSLTIKGPDSSLTEELVLQYDEPAISYRARVPGQNEGQAVPFLLVSADSGRYVFENLNHDFPQRIIYHFFGTDSVHARIEGMRDGKLRASDYPYTRGKP